MFSKWRQPPSYIDDLQNVHMDACNSVFQNLAYEDKGEIELALKGWKQLHTLVLFRIEGFEKLLSKFGPEEIVLFQELKALRDLNVKHLVRCQMKVEETIKKSHAISERPSVSNSNSSSMTVPSLRKGAPQRPLNTQPRSMRKSLRPNQGSRNPLMENASKAANVLWNNPKDTSYTDYLTSTDSNNQGAAAGGAYRYTESSPMDSPDEFADFDQNWERIENDPAVMASELKGLNISAIPSLHPSSQPNVLHSVSPPKSRRIEDDNYGGNSLLNPRPSLAPQALDQPIRSTSPAGKSKSALEVRTTKYNYTKPKPLNVNGIIRAQAKKSGRMVSSGSGNSRTKSPPSSSNLDQPNSSYDSNSNGYSLLPNGGHYKSTTVPKIYVKQPAKKALVKKHDDLKVVAPKSNGIDDKNKAQTKAPKVEKITKVEANIPPDAMSPTMDDLILSYGDDKEFTQTEEEQLLALIRGIDMDAGKQILNDIVVQGDEVFWNDIAGLEQAKNTLKETVVYPFLRPDLFSGLREPARGLLLFGPPGTGKTMLARAVATELKLTFFSISASSLTSKYLGESEKLVKALFLLARKLAPLIVFVDEIDSLLSQRNDGEVESSRRIKNEFLIQWSELSSAAAGKDTEGDVSRVLILGATNVPWAIDEAARRRFVKRQYIPLPEIETRCTHFRHLLSHQNHTLNDDDFNKLVELTQGFSGSDITALTKDAAMGPLRELGDKILTTPRDQIRAVGLQDFVKLMEYIRPSVLTQGIEQHEEWAKLYGLWGG